jgi:hypothetical protein
MRVTLDALPPGGGGVMQIGSRGASAQCEWADDTSKTNGFVEGFNGAILDGFVRVKLRENLYDSVETQQASPGRGTRSRPLVAPGTSECR